MNWQYTAYTVTSIVTEVVQYSNTKYLMLHNAVLNVNTNVFSVLSYFCVYENLFFLAKREC